MSSPPKTSQVALRHATASDVEGIADTFLGCWQESYARVLPASLVASMTEERARSMWGGVLGDAAVGDVVVATDPAGDSVIGVVRFERLSDGTGMVHSLYVSPRSQGLGAGARLLDAAAASLEERGVTLARLWVFRDNSPSIAFYRRQGWVADGVARTQDEFGEPEIRLARRLGSAEPAPAHPVGDSADMGSRDEVTTL